MPKIITLPVGSRGADFTADQFRRNNIIKDWLISDGITFVCMYVADGSWKGLNDDDMDWLQAHGIGRLFIKENRSTDIEGGTEAGARNGAVGRIQSLGHKYPAGLSITLCADQMVDNRNGLLGVDYMVAGGVALKPDYTTAGYVNTFLAKMMADRGTPLAMHCVPGAASWSRQLFRELNAKMPFTYTPHMIQRGRPKDRPDVNVDTLTTYLPVDVWLETPDPPPTLPPVKYPVLRLGVRGQFVSILQAKLHIHPVDGWYGPQTKAAVVKFQKKTRDIGGNKLKPDGIVGPLTWGAVLAGRK